MNKSGKLHKFVLAANRVRKLHSLLRRDRKTRKKIMLAKIEIGCAKWDELNNREKVKKFSRRDNILQKVGLDLQEC